MKNRLPISKKVFTAIFISFLATSKIYTQDSLYLVGTITGESYEKRINDVKGIGDVNRDGYDDFIVTHYFDKYAELYFGSSTLDLTPDIIFHYPNSDDSVRYFGISGRIGDVNNDGYDDFTISGAYLFLNQYPKGKVFLYYGGETIDTIPAAEFNEPWLEDGFGNSMEGVGDINKDGYDDFITTSPYNWTDARGRAYLFWGGDSISWERSITFASDSLEDFFGASTANIGDISKDGFDDIAISAIGTPSLDSGRVYVFYGGSQMDNKKDTILYSGNSDLAFGRIIKNAEDLNKDEIIDYCIASSDSIYVYLSNNNPLIIRGYSLDTKGDINGDTISDLIVGSDKKINVYFGSENFDINPDIIIDDSLRYSTAYINIAGDLNNDQYDEIVSLAPNWPNTENPQGKVYIYSYKKITDVKDYKGNRPNNFKLYQNYPNPFNPVTNIQYIIKSNQFVTLKIFDVLGKEIATLINEEKTAGKYEIEFNAAKYNLSSGVYFYSITAGNFHQVKKMILAK